MKSVSQLFIPDFDDTFNASFVCVFFPMSWRCHERHKISFTWTEKCHDPHAEGQRPCQVPCVRWRPGCFPQPLRPPPSACCSRGGVSGPPASAPRPNSCLPQSARPWYSISTSILQTKIAAWTDEGRPSCLIHWHHEPIDVSEPDDYLRTFCSYSAPSLCFPPSLVSYPSFYVSQAAVPNWLSQHLPAVHHGEHTADHPQRLHYFPADASHPPARHGPRPVAKGTACWHPVPCWSSRYDPWRVAPSLQCHDAWEYVCLCVCLWVAASVVCSLCSCEVVATFSDTQKQMTRSNFSDLPFHTRALNYLGCKSICYQIIFIQILHLLSGSPSKVDHNSIHTCSPVPFF